MTPPDDELMRLWQQGASSAPDASEIARLAARASMRRFDRLIARRNVIESVAAAGVLGFFAWRIAAGHDRLANALSSGCVAFVIAYLWWGHRHTAVVDAAADAEAYRTALLVRLDRQLALLRTARYWYLLPLFVPPVIQALTLWEKSRSAAIVWLIVVTVIYVGIGVLNERVGVTRLLAERAQLEALYRE
jgi:hypothetical protein